jgi:hypothetical protein
MVKIVKILFVAGAIAATCVLAPMSSQALAQTPEAGPTPRAQPHDAAAVEDTLVTPTGHELKASVTGYNYIEPGALRISIHGPKFGGEYTGTLSLDKSRHWFAQANVRGILGNVTYTGWCSPFLIRPNSASPNGYELAEGDASPCSENGDKDWYLEARALVGKDLIGRRWGWSPYSGLGLRHLSNGSTGNAGYRTDDYLFLPVGITARTNIASHRTLAFNLEYDRLIHGWQKTRDSELGSGDVPATTTAPAFTIDGFTDISFSQHGGWALRASTKYPVTQHWSVEPYYVHWSVNASPVNYETTTFTVNQITAHEQRGFYEPVNVTHEFGVKFGFHF